MPLPPPLPRTHHRDGSSRAWEGVGPYGEGVELQEEGPGKTIAGRYGAFIQNGFNSGTILSLSTTLPVRGEEVEGEGVEGGEGGVHRGSGRVLHTPGNQDVGLE